MARAAVCGSRRPRRPDHADAPRQCVQDALFPRRYVGARPVDGLGETLGEAQLAPVGLHLHLRQYAPRLFAQTRQDHTRAQAFAAGKELTQRGDAAGVDQRYQAHAQDEDRRGAGQAVEHAVEPVRDGEEQRSRDLEGFHTRFGDIKPLLGKVDDRYVIMNAGDEMQITFKEIPPPPAGWKRDYVVIGDGWEKDGNINTTFGKTVMPYPLHSLADYNTPPGRLQDDPAYKRNPKDWEEYHTRFVSPDAFISGLRRQKN